MVTNVVKVLFCLIYGKFQQFSFMNSLHWCNGDGLVHPCLAVQGMLN